MESEALAKLMLSLNVKEEQVGKHDYAGKAKEYIDKNFHKVTVESVASFVGLDRKYLRLLFVKRYGVSTMDYIITKRMERAKELLKLSSAPVGVVALSVGYDDALGFSRIFKKREGVSPKEYREQNMSKR
jgi:AraC-like DNA-binding protein